MSILRGIVKSIGGVIFAIMLVTAIVAIGLTGFTKYDNVKSIFLDMLGPQLQQIQSESEVNSTDMYQVALKMCEGKDNIEISVTEGGGAIRLDCNDIRNIKETDADFETTLNDIVVKSFFESIYYNEYDCNFIECLRENNFSVIVSLKGHEFFLNVQKFLFVGTAAGAAIIFLFSNTWDERFKGIGIPMTIVGMSYFIVDIPMENIISNFLPETQTQVMEAGISLRPIIEKLFEPMTTSLLIVFAIGIALTLIGFGISFYKKRYVEKTVKRKAKSKSLPEG